MATIERSEVLATVCRQLAEILEISATEISETQSLADDLGADSIALIELVDSLEQEFSDIIPDFQFQDDDLSGLRTVADAVNYIVLALGK
ncbi:MAG: acyl carrier protein [Actinomycetota bacterium]|jgi:acyl carrier protein